MNSHILEANVTRALVAYKVEGGMTEDAAQAWAAAHLTAALDAFKIALGKGKGEEPLQAAFDELKVWAATA